MTHLTLTKWSFLILGSITMLFGIWWGLRRWSALNWPATTATVLRSDLTEASGVEDPSATMYSNSVQFQYEVGGQPYAAKVNDWATTSSVERHRAIARRYAVGSQHQIRYNPDRPQDVYAEAGFTFGFFKVTVFCLGLGGLFAALGLFMFWWGGRGGR